MDATYFKVRENHRIVSKALMIAYGTNEYGEREIINFNAYANESKETWRDFLDMLKKQGLRDVLMFVSDAHEGIRKAIANTYPKSAKDFRTWFESYKDNFPVTVQDDHLQVDVSSTSFKSALKRHNRPGQENQRDAYKVLKELIEKSVRYRFVKNDGKKSTKESLGKMNITPP